MSGMAERKAHLDAIAASLGLNGEAPDERKIRRRARSKGPTVRELRAQAAERGDVDYFLDLIRTKAWCLFSLGEILQYLLRAAEVRARIDPEGHARATFAQMVGLNSFLLLRAQLVVTERAVGRGRKPIAMGIGDLSLEVVERLLPRLMELQAATAELLVAQARAARLWGLARAKSGEVSPLSGDCTESPQESTDATSKRSGRGPSRSRTRKPDEATVLPRAGGRRHA